MKIKDIILIGGLAVGAYFLSKIRNVQGAIPIAEYLAAPSAYPQGNTILNQMPMEQAIIYAAANPNTYNPQYGILVSETGLGYSVSAENVPAMVQQIAAIPTTTSVITQAQSITAAQTYYAGGAAPSYSAPAATPLQYSIGSNIISGMGYISPIDRRVIPAPDPSQQYAETHYYDIVTGTFKSIY